MKTTNIEKNGSTLGISPLKIERNFICQDLNLLHYTLRESIGIRDYAGYLPKLIAVVLRGCKQLYYNKTEVKTKKKTQTHWIKFS